MKIIASMFGALTTPDLLMLDFEEFCFTAKEI